MEESAKARGSYVAGPDGQVLTLANLPPRNTRWVARRKAEIVLAVSGGILSMAEACTRYTLSSDEFVAWESMYMKRGLAGLRARARPDRAVMP